MKTLLSVNAKKARLMDGEINRAFGGGLFPTWEKLSVFSFCFGHCKRHGDCL
jgi:hypothetical protein